MTLTSADRAWCWTGSSSPLDLKLGKAERRPLTPGEVRVANRAAGLNPVDWKVLGGLPGWKPGKVVGCDGAGEVVEVGPGVPEGLVGQRVTYHQHLSRDGSFADHTVVAARALVPVPAAMDWAAAAGFPCPSLTAWLAAEKLPLRPGADVAVVGAGGGVGNLLVQLLRDRGYSVTAQAHPRHHDRLRALGAGPVTDLGPAFPRFFGVIDLVSEALARASAGHLKANGHLVCVQGRLSSWPNEAFSTTVSLHEVALGALHVYGDDQDWGRLTSAGEDILGRLAAGTLVPEPLVTAPFADLPRLLEALRRRDFTGKPVVVW